jgi:hypothetical protein
MIRSIAGARPQTKLALGVFVVALLLGAGVTRVARAGSVDNTQVSIFTTDGLDAANGTLRAVRNSGDGTQYIGCSRYAYDTGSDSIVCYAMDSMGAYKSCFTGNDAMLRVAETLNPAAYLYFVVNADGSCNRVITVLASFDM